MSMNATDAGISASATFRATVDFPEPDPPAMPMIVGFIARNGAKSTRKKVPASLRKREASGVSRSCIVRWRPEGVNDRRGRA